MSDMRILKGDMKDANRLAVAAFHLYFVSSSMLALSEPWLVGYPAAGGYQNTQIFVLALSTIFYFIGIISMTRLLKSTSSMGIKGYFNTMLQPPVIFEGICLLIGWVFIYPRPGLASIRCFRVFRLLWIIDMYYSDYDQSSSQLFFFVNVIGKNCQLCLRYFKCLGEELTSSNSRGAIVVLVVFFYVTYIVAVIFWIDRGTFDFYDPIANSNATIQPDRMSTNSNCITLRSCFMTLLRLSYYDGGGFEVKMPVCISDPLRHSPAR
jgi:hypothetical protein